MHQKRRRIARESRKTAQLWAEEQRELEAARSQSRRPVSVVAIVNPIVRDQLLFVPAVRSDPTGQCGRQISWDEFTADVPRTNN